MLFTNMEICDHKKHNGVQIILTEVFNPNPCSYESPEASFKVISEVNPDYDSLKKMLMEAFPGCNFYYDIETGVGRIKVDDVIDPDLVDTVITLGNPIKCVECDADLAIETFDYGEKMRKQAKFLAQLFPFGLPSDLSRMTFIRNRYLIGVDDFLI